MATKIDLKNAAQELHDLAHKLEQKSAPTDQDFALFDSKMADFRKLQVAVEKDDAKSFMNQLSGSGDGDPLAALGNGKARLDSKTVWADDVAKRITKTAGEFGVKALSTGGIDIPSTIEPVVIKPTAAGRVLDLLVNRKPLPGNEFEYLRQTVRTNNAAPVADNATKPTSVYTFEDEFDRARVFAHLSEAIPLRFLADHDELRTILSSQMAEDLYIAIEADVLAGDGTGEHFTGLANTTGVLAQAYTTDVITTLRKARTALTTTGENPTAWVLNYADLEAIDLMRENGATGGFMDGINDKVFGNLPKVGTSVIPAGTAYLGDWNQIRLYVREQARLDADVSGVLFEKNQTKLRFEGRFGMAVLRPSAFVEIDLTA